MFYRYFIDLCYLYQNSLPLSCAVYTVRKTINVEKYGGGKLKFIVLSHLFVIDD